ncbi:SPFH domain-containing protein [Candidatus Uabimicrobium sp. HlEnr_7]|uniref:SPFH domain-containing protein n=1 Tax=Candidatus Uabimicrobium helgolandensis TaxID=3095367 RepID=UPI003556E5FD
MVEEQNNNSEELSHVNELADKSLEEALKLSFKILKGIMLLLICVFIGSGVFIVDQHEVALVMRFGDIVGTKVDREKKPGPHWTFPFPISKVTRVDKRDRTLILDDFWYYEDPDVNDKMRRRRAKDNLDPEKDGYVLTNDANIVHVEKLQIRYKVKSAYNYVMFNENPKQLLHNIVLGATIKAVASFSVNDTRKKSDEMIDFVTINAQKRLDRLRSGLEITWLSFRIIPPLSVQDAFDSVIKAEVKKLKDLEMAIGYAMKVENEVKSAAAKIIRDAETFKSNIVQRAQSDAKYLQAIKERFKNTPEVYQEMQYNKVLEEISSEIYELFILSSSSNNRELRLRINRDPELKKFKAPEGQEPDILEKEEN